MVIIQNINIKYDNDNFDLELATFINNNGLTTVTDSYLIFILSNKKYLILNDDDECANTIFYTYLNTMDKDTIIIKGNISVEKMYRNIRHLLNGKNELLDFNNDTYTHSKWIANYNIEFIDKNKFKTNSQEYLVVKPDYFSPVSKYYPDLVVIAKIIMILLFYFRLNK